MRWRQGTGCPPTPTWVFRQFHDDTVTAVCGAGINHHIPFSWFPQVNAWLVITNCVRNVLITAGRRESFAGWARLRRWCPLTSSRRRTGRPSSCCRSLQFWGSRGHCRTRGRGRWHWSRVCPSGERGWESADPRRALYTPENIRRVNT